MSSSDSKMIPPFSALESQEKEQVKHWLFAAMVCIVLSGIAPLLLLAGRASVYAEVAQIKTWFVPVLVIHVNLSVGLWFIALTMMLWRLYWPIKLPSIWHEGCVLTFLTGVLAMVAAPFAGGDAFTSNYIPVQNNPLFFFGLSLIFACLLCMIAPYLWAILRQKTHALISMNVLTLSVALGCFALSIMQHPEGYGGRSYYEAIFWGGGHVLQFVYVQIAAIAWLWLASHLSIPLPSRKVIFTGFGVLTAAAISSPLIYLFEDINSYYHIKFFSWQMNIITGTVPALLAVWLFVKLFKAQTRNTTFWVLLSSLSLFLSGGFVGFLIEGSNTIIPAHYHGSTVGVTLALMGAAYLSINKLGGHDVSQWKMAKLQPVLYGAGQLLHVVGFAIAGSEGVQRKVAGKMEGASELAQAGMQLTRFGGILAVIGGGLFVVVMIRAWSHKPKN